MTTQYADRHGVWGRKALRSYPDIAGFRCVQCRQFVSAVWRISGVRNRNHCPYCLHSRHLDLWHAGDRLAACKGCMQPVGLTFKRVRNRYGEALGELMLVHRCTECGKLSINRIAADDDGDAVLALLEQPAPADLEAPGIHLLTDVDLAWVQAQLFGKN
jgi:DNA-directed RNA polymerase subunit RPC12/RpoP